MDPQTYSISDLAQEFSITTRTIRFYEDQGLITPLREGQHRIYSRRDRTRLKLILRGKRLGFALSEIGEIIALYDHQGGESDQLRYLLEKIREHREQLIQQRHDIDLTLDELDEVEHQALAALDRESPTAN